MAAKKKREPMTTERALDVIRDEMKCWCAEYNEETGEQCKAAPTLTVHNVKMDTTHHWCAEHSPGKQHFADRETPFEGGEALAFLRAVIAAAGGAK